MADQVTFADVPGFPGYRVGDDGSVWSCRTNSGKTSANWKRLSAISDKDGYLRVTLSRTGEKPKIIRVAHVVLMSFVGPRPDGTESAHENGNNTDNRRSNLSWKKHIDNCADKIRHGTVLTGESHPNAKIKSEDVVEIRRLSSIGVSTLEISRRFPISRKAIDLIIQRKSWAHV